MHSDDAPIILEVSNPYPTPDELGPSSIAELLPTGDDAPLPSERFPKDDEPVETGDLRGLSNVEETPSAVWFVRTLAVDVDGTPTATDFIVPTPYVSLHFAEAEAHRVADERFAKLGTSTPEAWRAAAKVAGPYVLVPALANWTPPPPRTDVVQPGETA